MPSSDPAARIALVNHIKDIGVPHSILDLGVGAGGYGMALAEFRRISPYCQIYGIEIWAPYLIKFEQNFINSYDKIYISDIRYFDYSFINADLVIAGDVLEHLPKGDCIRLIDKLVDRYKWILISLPIQRFEQGPDNEYGNIYEEHLCHWTIKEIESELGFKFVTRAGVCGIFEYKGI